jgi:esterase/lipase superfamily enzyme
MYVVTNRKINEKKKGLNLFGDTPSAEGPNALRLVEVTKRGSGYQTKLLGDELTQEEVVDLKQRFKLAIDETRTWYASLRVACELMAQAAQNKRHVLIFVHGYNNDMGDVLDTAEAIEALYDVIVLPFCWPANGGRPVSGTLAYLDDKQDARVSMDALNRFLTKVHQYHMLLTEARRDELWAQALAASPNNLGAAQERFSVLQHKDCKVTLNLMCHSMGNYVLKYALGPSNVGSRELVFDNVSLVAADANNAAHEVWAERIQVRNRLYIVINEDDFALAWSRRKPGQEQLERLGQYLKNLIARNARYIDVTGADAVGNAHGYYTGKPVKKNQALLAVFKAAFEGGRAEDALRYTADINAYRLS